MSILTQEQAIQRLRAMQKIVVDHRDGTEDDNLLLGTLAEFLDTVGWCDQHGKPLSPMGTAPCPDCIDGQDTMQKFEAEHGPDKD